LAGWPRYRGRKSPARLDPLTGAQIKFITVEAKRQSRLDLKTMALPGIPCGMRGAIALRIP
jgi:hypothetical protein